MKEALDWMYEEVDSHKTHQVEGYWKIMIIDDEPEVHQVTKLVLHNFMLDGKGLQFISGYTGTEAERLLVEHPDTAILLLDVVMEKDDSGLQIVKFVRQQLQNKQVRIILRTGQPGQAPERNVVREYDINDYKEKTELTTEKLFTTIYTSLKTYQMFAEIQQSRDQIAMMMKELDQNNQQLERKVQEKTWVLEMKNRQYRQSIWETTSALVEVSIHQERVRIAKEIHDVAGYTMTGSIIQSEWIKNLIPAQSELALEKIEQLQDHLRQGLNQIRQAVHRMQENKQTVEFHSLLLQLLADTKKNMGVDISYRMEQLEGLEDLHNELKEVIFHALQEGLTNGIRHGESTKFEFQLYKKEDYIHFVLTNNGKSINEVSLGFGLTTMKEQVEQCNGKFSISSGENKGCTLQLSIPCNVFDADKEGVWYGG